MQSIENERGPWPQPAPGFPDRAAPAVVHLPKSEKSDWDKHVGYRYVRQVVTETPKAFLWARKHHGVKPVSDARFVEILCDGIVSKFLTPTLEAVDRARFAAQLEGDAAIVLGEGERFLKSDFSPMIFVKSDADSATAPTVVLFRHRADGSNEVLAIAVVDRVFTPGDGHAWELAKLFALQGAGIVTTLLMHPLLHFPTDAVNAITKTLLPDGHVLKQLLLPHFRLQLGVDDAVLHGGGTVLRPGYVYSPYPGSFDEHLQLVSTLWRGYEYDDGTPNRAYPPYSFPLAPRAIHSPYGTFLEKYWRTIYELVNDVVAKIPVGDRWVREWAHHVSFWTTGFPDEDAIFEGDTLARALTSIIADVSVGHSADHYLYSEVDIQEVPFILRLPVPTSRNMPAFDRSKANNVVDTMKYKMCMKMFFNVYNVALLADVDYGFTDPDLVRRAAAFRGELAATETAIKQSGLRNYIPLREIAASVQF